MSRLKRKRKARRQPRSDEVLQNWSNPAEGLDTREIRRWIELKGARKPIARLKREHLLKITQAIIDDVTRACSHEGPFVLRDELARFSYTNSKDIPRYVNLGGVRMEWVGIGWIDVGVPKPNDVLVVEKWMEPYIKRQGLLELKSSTEESANGSK